MTITVTSPRLRITTSTGQTLAVSETLTRITVRQGGVSLTPAAPANVVTVGRQGPSGPPGLDAHFTFTQNAPATTWAVTHNLGKYPAVAVVDSAGTAVLGQITYLDPASLRLDFTAPFSGTAYLN